MCIILSLNEDFRRYIDTHFVNVCKIHECECCSKITCTLFIKNDRISKNIC